MPMTQQNPENLAMKWLWLLSFAAFVAAFVARLLLRDWVPPWLRFLLVALSWALAAGLFIWTTVRARSLPDGLALRRQRRLWFASVTTGGIFLIVGEPLGAIPTWAQALVLLLFAVCVPIALITFIAEAFRRDDREKQNLRQNAKHSR
jgi:hypothetical protein